MISSYLKHRIKELAYIYMILDENGYTKIGISKDPNKRIKQLQTGHPSKLTLFYTEEFNCTRNRLLKIEKLLHRELAWSYKHVNGEWFVIPSDKLINVKNKISFFRIRYEEGYAPCLE